MKRIFIVFLLLYQSLVSDADCKSASAMQTILTPDISVKASNEQDYPGRENHFVNRRLEAEAITIEQGVFVRSAQFESWRSVYWVKPNAGVARISVNVKVSNGLRVAFRQDGLKNTTASNNSASFEIHNGKRMTEIEIIISDGSQERSYYLDVCDADPQNHDIVVDYYGLLPYPQTHQKTRALVDQITGAYTVTPQRIDFIANYLAGSQKNTKDLINPVKIINPNWHSLHYHLAIWNNPDAHIIIDNTWSKAEWESLVNELFIQDPYIFMYAVDKNTGKTTWVKDLAYGAYLMNISNENYFQFLIKNLEYQCKSTGYESIFFDSFALGTVYSFTNYNYIGLGGGSDVPYEFTKYENPQLGGLTWLQASEEFISRLNKSLNRRGIWLLPNHGSQQTVWDPLDYALTNGGMLEGIPMRPDNNGNTGDRLYLYDWILSMSRTMYLTQKDRVVILQPYLGDINNLNYRLFVLGEYLMVRGRYTYLNLCVGGQEQASWYPEYEIDLGAPTQTHTIPDILFTPWKESIDRALLNYKVENLFVRQFEKGLVVINPHRTWEQFMSPSNKDYQMAVINGGGTVPESGIANLVYSLEWVDIQAESVIHFVPPEGALILRFSVDDTESEKMESKPETVNVFTANGLIHIIATASDPIQEVTVYNPQGALVHQTKAINTITYAFNLNQPAGIYIINIITAKKNMMIKQIWTRSAANTR